VQNQILGYSSTAIYQEYYRNLKVQCDVESAFAGLPTDDGLLKIANLMSRTIDSRTPWTLNKAEIADIEQSSQEASVFEVRGVGCERTMLPKVQEIEGRKGHTGAAAI